MSFSHLCRTRPGGCVLTAVMDDVSCSETNPETIMSSALSLSTQRKRITTDINPRQGWHVLGRTCVLRMSTCPFIDLLIYFYCNSHLISFSLCRLLNFKDNNRHACHRKHYNEALQMMSSVSCCICSFYYEEYTFKCLWVDNDKSCLLTVFSISLGKKLGGRKFLKCTVLLNFLSSFTLLDLLWSGFFPSEGL